MYVCMYVCGGFIFIIFIIFNNNYYFWLFPVCFLHFLFCSWILFFFLFFFYFFFYFFFCSTIRSFHLIIIAEFLIRAAKQNLITSDLMWNYWLACRRKLKKLEINFGFFFYLLIEFLIFVFQCFRYTVLNTKINIKNHY